MRAADGGMVSADEAITRAVGIKRARSYDAREGQSQRPTEKNATNRNADETSNTSEPEESNEYEELRLRIISDNKALFTDKRVFLMYFCDSIPIVGLVLLLVCVHTAMTLSGYENEAFEYFTSAFFIVEVSCRIWANTPRYFFLGYSRRCSDTNRWMNCIDFLLSFMDVVGIIMTNLLAGDTNTSDTAKSARITRAVRLLKFARMARMVRIFRMFLMVFARQRDKEVEKRTKEVMLEVAKSRGSWQVARGQKASFDPKSPIENVAGLELSKTKSQIHRESRRSVYDAEGHLRRNYVRQQIDNELQKKKVVGENGQMRLARRGSSSAQTGQKISLCAPTSELAVEFGIAVGLYFRATELFAVWFLLLFLVSLPSIKYFASDAYSNGTAARFEYSLIWGTGVCNNSVTVEAMTNRSVYNDYLRFWDAAAERGAQAGHWGAHGVTSTVHHACYLGDSNLYSSLGILVVILSMFSFFRFMVTNWLVEVDESVQTAQDYSLVVNDPPVDAYDPQEWYDYFKEHGDIAAITVVVDNSDLLERLARHKLFKLVIESMPEVTYSRFKPDMNPHVRSLLNELGVGLDKLSYVEKFKKNMVELRCYLRQRYQVRKVFVTFDEEGGQRRALEALQQGSIPASMDIAIGLEPEQYFRGKDPTCGGKYPNARRGEVLALEEAPEPEELFYENIGLASVDQRSMQKLVMMLWLFFFMALEYQFVKAMDANESTRMYSGLAITLSNALVPEMLHVCSDLFEVHETDSSKIASVYNKISVFRYFNTVIIVYLISDFSLQLSEEQLTKVLVTLSFDAFLTPLLYYFNASYYLNRWVISRFVTNEHELKYVLGGCKVRLSDRYSNLAKCCFVGLFYLPVLPTGAFLAFCHCTLSSLADRHGLLRNWRSLPPTGAKVLFQALSTHVVFAIIAHLFMAGVFYSQWSYDSACAATRTPLLGVGNTSSLLGPDISYYECDKAYSGGLMGIVTHDWMSEPQQHLVKLYRWCFVVVVSMGALGSVVLARGAIRSLFTSSVHFDGKDQGTRWSKVPCIQLYVPRVIKPQLPFPLVACDIQAFDTSHTPWSCNFDEHSAWNDAQKLIAELRKDPTVEIDPVGQQLFSTCTQYVKTGTFEPRKMDSSTVETSTGDVGEPVNPVAASDIGPAVGVGQSNPMHHESKGQGGEAATASMQRQGLRAKLFKVKGGEASVSKAGGHREKEIALV